jgi:hypothetical protein
LLPLPLGFYTRISCSCQIEAERGLPSVFDLKVGLTKVGASSSDAHSDKSDEDMPKKWGC